MGKKVITEHGLEMEAEGQKETEHLLGKETISSIHWATHPPTEFFLSIPIQYQAGKWWDQRKISIRRLLVNPMENSQNKIYRIV